MTLPINLSEKKTKSSLVIIIISIAGMGSYSTYSVFDHVMDDTPHLGTTKTLEYFEKRLDEYNEANLLRHSDLDEKIYKVHEKLDGILMIMCSNPNNKCT